MIAADSITKISTTVVYSTGDVEEELVGPGLLLGADLLGLSQFIDAPEVRQSTEGLVLSSMRNQLTVIVSPSSLAFVDGSDEEPVREDFPSRVAEVAEYIGSRSGQTYSTVSFDFEIESNEEEKESPLSQIILNRLVKEDALNEIGYDAIGASARLWYAARDRVHELRIEPGETQYDSLYYYAGLGVHIELETVPPAKWLLRALHEEYDDFKRVLAKVLTS